MTPTTLHHLKSPFFSAHSITRRLALSAVAACAAFLCIGDAKANFSATIQDSLIAVYPDSEIDAAVDALSQASAAGAIVSAHVLATDLPAGTTRILVDGPLPARVSQLLAVPVEHNTGVKGWAEPRTGEENPDVIRNALFSVYDAIKPLADNRFDGSGTAAFRIDVDVPADFKPGSYAWRIQLVNTTTKTLTLNVEVFAVSVPPVSDASFSYSAWASIWNMAKYHDVKWPSKDFWQLHERYAELMHRGRVNVGYILASAVLHRDKEGNLRLVRDRLQRHVDLYRQAGIPTIEMAHLGVRKGSWNSKRYNVALNGPLATSPEGKEEIASICTELMAFIRENKLEKHWLQHVADEPHHSNEADFRELAAVVRQHMPNIQLVDAIMTTDLPGALDVYVPQLHHFIHDREHYDQTRRDGAKVWVYTCLGTGGPNLNRMLDHERLRPLLIGWAASKYQWDGYLNWATNFWAADPLKQSSVDKYPGSNPSTVTPPGDTHVFYPDGPNVLSSTRFEATREGMEDYELLRRLPDDVRKPIIASILDSASSYTKDPVAYRAAKRRLLVAAAATNANQVELP